MFVMQVGITSHTWFLKILYKLHMQLRIMISVSYHCYELTWLILNMLNLWIWEGVLKCRLTIL